MLLILVIELTEFLLRGTFHLPDEFEECEILQEVTELGHFIILYLCEQGTGDDGIVAVSVGGLGITLPHQLGAGKKQ